MTISQYCNPNTSFVDDRGTPYELDDDFATLDCVLFPGVIAPHRDLRSVPWSPDSTTLYPVEVQQMLDQAGDEVTTVPDELYNHLRQVVIDEYNENGGSLSVVDAIQIVFDESHELIEENKDWQRNMPFREFAYMPIQRMYNEGYTRGCITKSHWVTGILNEVLGVPTINSFGIFARPEIGIGYGHNENYSWFPGFGWVRIDYELGVNIAFRPKRTPAPDFVDYAYLLFTDFYRNPIQEVEDHTPPNFDPWIRVDPSEDNALLGWDELYTNIYCSKLP